MNWPNRITIFRIILIPIFIISIMYSRLDIALVIFLVASLSDALDGYLARVLGQKTHLGSILDPIADKMLINSAFVSFSLVKELPAYLRMPVYVPVVIISRDVLILIGAITLYFVNGKLDVKPSMLGKATTCLQMFAVILLLVKFVYSSWAWNIAVFFTVLSGIDYLRIWTGEVNGKI